MVFTIGQWEPGVGCCNGDGIVATRNSWFGVGTLSFPFRRYEYLVMEWPEGFHSGMSLGDEDSSGKRAFSYLWE